MPGKRFGFDYLHECVINALAAEGLPADQLTAKTARMLGIIDAERGRIKRVNDWNRQQNAGTPGTD